MNWHVNISSQSIFKRDSNGNIRVWSFQTGYNDQGQHGWRTNSGVQDGKMVTSGWKVVEPKNVGKVNATTPEQQAEAEGWAEYNKKLERGYFTSFADVDSFEKTKPMLAVKYEDVSFDFESERNYSQPKLDGIRCVARRDGLWSRSGKQHLNCEHIEKYLKPFFDNNPNVILDGEFYNHDLRDDFNKITSLVRKSKPTAEDREESSQVIQYHVYDAIVVDKPNMNFIERWNFVYNQGFSSCVQVVKTREIASKEALDEIYASYLENGYEGQMIRKNTPYEFKRCKSLIKRKEFLTDEFNVESIEEGKGNWAGYVKRFILKTENGQEFGAGVRGDQDSLRKLYTEMMIGKKPDWCTLRYFTPTPDGIPRFPVVIDWGYGKRTD